jgi:hypothetical protein
MNRLTKFEKNPNSKFPYKLKDDSLCTELDGIHTLGLIEDLLDQYNVKDLEELDKLLTIATSYEEISKQIGCPLEVVVKALLNGVYESYTDYGDNNSIKIRHREVRGIGEYGLIVINTMCSYAECDETFEYKDYKKTWWLKEDREE